MKTIILLAITLFSNSLLFAQISDVRNENSMIVVYNSQGERVSSMSDAFDKKVVAITNGFFVTDDGTTITTYDAKCSRLGSMFSSGKTVLGGGDSTFNVEEFGRTVVYDSECSRISGVSLINSREIADVRIENSSIVVYNAHGDKISSMFSSDKQIAAKTGAFFILQNDYHIETYDAECHLIGSMFAPDKIVRGAVGSTFTVEENGWIVTYDSKCTRLSTQPKR